MTPTYVYPASFCPPTFGHLHTVEKAAALFPELILVCSVNPEKDSPWFSPEECRDLWSSYHLSANVRVITLDELQARNKSMSDLVMVRGIRDANDAEYEKRVMLFNKECFGIDKYFYLFACDAVKDISSSLARRLAGELKLEDLSACVSPLVISKVLEKALGIKNLFMVVGRPGSGKSTFFRKLAEIDPSNVHINTDDFNHELRPLLAKIFGDEDLIKLALEDEEKLKRAIAGPWMDLLRDALRKLPRDANAFVEIPYGMQADKRMYRFVGGKVICVDCRDLEVLKSRVHNRNTPRLASFIDKIPGVEETKKIVEENRLNLVTIDTSCTLDELHKKTEKFNTWLKEEETKWKTCLPGYCLDI